METQPQVSVPHCYQHHSGLCSTFCVAAQAVSGAIPFYVEYRSFCRFPFFIALEMS